MPSDRKTNRRAFLKGKSAAQAMADAAGSLIPAPAPLAEPAQEGYLLRFCRRAMACQFEIFLNAGQHERDGQAALAALDLVDQLEAQLSIYRESSEISAINRTAATVAVAVEPRLFALLEQAIRLSRQTDGAFDITAGPLARLWGFVERSAAMPAADSISAVLDHVGSRYLELDPLQQTIRFEQPGVEINLGSIGKGYALDRCAETIVAAGVDDFLLHGGNSSVLARGRGGSGPAGRLDDRTARSLPPRAPDRPTASARSALATSGSGTQFFLHEGRRYGHILDPRSGWPAEGVLSATALAPSAAAADALSTAFYVLGPQRAGEFCAANRKIGCVLLCPGPRHATVEIHAFGLSDGEFVPEG